MIIDSTKNGRWIIHLRNSPGCGLIVFQSKCFICRASGHVSVQENTMSYFSRGESEKGLSASFLYTYRPFSFLSLILYICNCFVISVISINLFYFIKGCVLNKYSMITNNIYHCHRFYMYICYHPR